MKAEFRLAFIGLWHKQPGTSKQSSRKVDGARGDSADCVWWTSEALAFCPPSVPHAPRSNAGFPRGRPAQAMTSSCCFMGCFASAGVLRPLRRHLHRELGVSTATLSYAPGTGCGSHGPSVGTAHRRSPPRNSNPPRRAQYGWGDRALVCFKKLGGDPRVVQTISLGSPFNGTRHARFMPAARPVGISCPKARRSIDFGKDPIAAFRTSRSRPEFDSVVTECARFYRGDAFQVASCGHKRAAVFIPRRTAPWTDRLRGTHRAAATPRRARIVVLLTAGAWYALRPRNVQVFPQTGLPIRPRDRGDLHSELRGPGRRPRRGSIPGLDRPSLPTVKNSLEAAPMLQLDAGMGTSPARPFVFGGLFRVAPNFGFGTDLSLLARATSRNFVNGGWGGAIDLGAYARFWGEGSTGFHRGTRRSVGLGASPRRSAGWSAQTKPAASFSRSVSISPVSRFTGARERPGGQIHGQPTAQRAKSHYSTEAASAWADEVRRRRARRPIGRGLRADAFR